jgi:hypothetical protein
MITMTSNHANHLGLVRENNEDSLRTDDSLGIYMGDAFHTAHSEITAKA